MRNVLMALGLLLSLPAAAKEKPQVPAELAPTHGYAYVAFPKGGGGALTVRPVAGGKDLVIDTAAAAVSLPAAHAFGEWLPAGRYRIRQWGPYTWENGPEFDIVAGRVTDLGDWLPVNVGGYEFVVVPVPHPEHAGSLAAALPPIAAALQDPAPVPFAMPAVSSAIRITQPSAHLGLIVDLLVAYERKVNKPSTLAALKAAKDPAEFLRLARLVTQPLQDEPARLADGTLFFGADLGQLRRRSPAGEWSTVGIDTLRQVLAVEHADGRLVAGSDDGRLRESRDGGATWTDLKALGRTESILDIDHAGGAWLVTTSERFDDADAPRGSGILVAARGAPSVRLKVYVARQGDLADLALSKTFTIAPKDQIGWLGARGQLVDGHYYVMAGTAVERLDLATGAWKTITPGPRVSSLRVDPATHVLTALWSQGAFSKVHVSSDRGEQWTPIGRPPYIINDVQMDGPDKGWASRWNMNAFSGVWETYAFAPAKNDWVKSGEAPFNCRLLRVAQDLPVLCIAPDGSILRSSGGQWEAEFSAQ